MVETVSSSNLGSLAGQAGRATQGAQNIRGPRLDTANVLKIAHLKACPCILQKMPYSAGGHIYAKGCIIFSQLGIILLT